MRVRKVRVECEIAIRELLDSGLTDAHEIRTALYDLGFASSTVQRTVGGMVDLVSEGGGAGCRRSWHLRK